jgi:DHA2 family multidrug resistance protein
MFFIMCNLLASIVLLPIYLQTLMGYTATLAGIVLAPGGIAALFAMGIVGILVSRMNPKFIVAFGVIVTAYANYQMSIFTRSADFHSILMPRIFMGIGLGCMIIPLFSLTLSHIKKEDMGNATAIFNFMRNLGGSFGVAVATTILTRRAQFHQARLVDHLTPFDMNYILGSQQTAEILQNRGLEPMLAHKGGLAVIYQTLLKEANMMSFNDVFYLLAVMIVLTLPLIFLIKHIKYSKSDKN